MQTILGANGQIANELAKALKREHTAEIRLVSRNPRKINDTDTLLPADLLDAAQTCRAVEGSETVYLTVGLPMNSEMWAAKFPVMMRNAIDACRKHGAKLVFFDNTYMYPQDSRLLTEESPFAPVGRKGRVRQEIAEMLLQEMTPNAGRLKAVICRAPEFYGPGKTQSITNSFIFDRIHRKKKPKILLRDDTLRTLIWTPDASRAMALIGNTPDAYGQTWHLPCDDNRLTYRQFMSLVSDVYGERISYSVIPKIALRIGSMFSEKAREIQELLPRYEHDNLFDSSKFKTRFPDFAVVSLEEGIRQIKAEQGSEGEFAASLASP